MGLLIGIGGGDFSETLTRRRTLEYNAFIS